MVEVVLQIQELGNGVLEQASQRLWAGTWLVRGKFVAVCGLAFYSEMRCLRLERRVRVRVRVVVVLARGS